MVEPDDIEALKAALANAEARTRVAEARLADERAARLAAEATGVAEISGKRRELLLDIGPFAIPAEKRPDGETVPKVVHARPGVIVRASQTDLARQTPEDTMNILMQQATATLGNEEMLAAARAKMSIASLGVAAECRAGRRVQRHHARLSPMSTGWTNLEMVRLEGESSNSLFEILEDWNTHLKAVKPDRRGLTP